MNIIEKARDLAKAITQDEIFAEMRKAKEKNDKNLELQEKISDFNLKKIALNRENSKSEPDGEKIAKYDYEASELYKQIMENPDMVAYAEAKKKLDTVMKKIEFILAMTINGQNPDEISVPEGTGCSGNCSDCAGCH